MVKAIYARYGVNTISPQDSKEQAIEFLNSMEGSGACYAIGIFDEEHSTLHLSDNSQIAGRTSAEVIEEKLHALKKLGIVPLKIEHLA